MIRLLLFAACFAASANQVRWATRLGADVKTSVDRLTDCGVQGRVLHWKTGRDSSSALLVTALPTRVSACPAPWMFLHDRDSLALLRAFMVSHEGLLINLRGAGPPNLVRTSVQSGYGDLIRLEPAIGEAVLVVRQDSDFFEITGAMKRYDDYVHGFLAKAEERFRDLGLTTQLLRPTLDFVREARVAAASAHALAKESSRSEYQMMADGSVMVLSHEVVSQIHREQLLRELRAHFFTRVAQNFARAYIVIQAVIAPARREDFDILLSDAVGAKDFKTLGLATMFPKCASEL